MSGEWVRLALSIVPTAALVAAGYWVSVAIDRARDRALARSIHAAQRRDHVSEMSPGERDAVRLYLDALRSQDVGRRTRRLADQMAAELDEADDEDDPDDEAQEPPEWLRVVPYSGPATVMCTACGWSTEWTVRDGHTGTFMHDCEPQP